MDTRETMTAVAIEAPAAAANPVAEATTSAVTHEAPAKVVPPEVTLTVADTPASAPMAAPAPASRIEIPSVDLLQRPDTVSAADTIEDAKLETIAAVAAAKPSLPPYARLAAGLALAAVLGAFAGAATTAAVAPASPPPVAPAVAAHDTNALKASIAQLGRDLAGLKHGIDAIGRSTATQFKSVSERLDRTEKAQLEPAAKLAKISESLDRLERRVAATAPDVTGSVTTVQKHPSKPPTIEGWKVVDAYGGRVVLESRAGQLYEIGPGSNLPGVGKVSEIKRENGRVVVVTAKGIITAAAQPQPPLPRPAPYYGPSRY